jgi:MFS family permease
MSSLAPRRSAVFPTCGRAVFNELAALFFLHWMGLATWQVPLTLVLKAHGLGPIQPYAFATAALASFVSPLFFGAVADRRALPVHVLRWLALATAAAVILASASIELGWNRWLVLGLIQVYALCNCPMAGIASAIALERMAAPRREFGPIRAMGTLGWMAGCWVVSALGADASTRAGLSGAVVWLGLAAFTFLPSEAGPLPAATHLTLGQRLGLDALSLLKTPGHRVVFIGAALFSMPLAAFYPFTPPHLRDAGLVHASAWMSLGQSTEILSMFLLAALLARWGRKWVMAAGLGFGVLRFVLCALDGAGWLLTGVALHGFAYALFFTTAQIHVNDRVDPAFRARAQALLSLMTGGVGNLLGYLGTGGWYAACRGPNGVTAWPLFWGGTAAAVAAVMVYFLTACRALDGDLGPALG